MMTFIIGLFIGANLGLLFAALVRIYGGCHEQRHINDGQRPDRHRGCRGVCGDVLRRLAVCVLTMVGW